MFPKRKVLPYATGFVLGCLILFLLPKREISREPHPWHAQTAPEGTYPMEVVDDYGRRVQLDKQPRYFISLAPGITELLYAMEMGDHLMAVTEWCDYPEPAKALRDGGAHVGRMDQPDLEKIAAYSPDLILASNLTPPDVLNALSNQPRLRCLAFEHTSFEDLLQDIASLGIALGVPGKSLQLQLKLKQAWNETAGALDTPAIKTAAPARALFLLSIEDEGRPGWAPGAEVWITGLIEAAHGINVASSIGSSWGEVSFENLLLMNPDVLLLRRAESASAQERLEAVVNDLHQHPVWSQVPAIRNKRIHWLPYAPLTIPGPRMPDAFKAIAHALWPDLQSASEGLASPPAALSEQPGQVP